MGILSPVMERSFLVDWKSRTANTSRKIISLTWIMGRGSHFSKTVNGESYLAVIAIFFFAHDVRNNGVIERDTELYIFVGSVGSMIYRYGLYNGF